MDRGVRLDRTYQLNFGGNTDFLNMLERERLESKKISKTNAVTSMLDYELDPRRHPRRPVSDHVPWLKDRKWCYIRMEGTTFGDVPLNAELKLEVWDSPNSAGVITDAIRCLKLGLDRGLSGTLVAPSSYFMKSPPIQIHDDIAFNRVEAFIRGEDNETLVGTETVKPRTYRKLAAPGTRVGRRGRREGASGLRARVRRERTAERGRAAPPDPGGRRRDARRGVAAGVDRTHPASVRAARPAQRRPQAVRAARRERTVVLRLPCGLAALGARAGARIASRSRGRCFRGRLLRLAGQAAHHPRQRRARAGPARRRRRRCAAWPAASTPRYARFALELMRLPQPAGRRAAAPACAPRAGAATTRFLALWERCQAEGRGIIAVSGSHRQHRGLRGRLCPARRARPTAWPTTPRIPSSSRCSTASARAGG